MTELHLKRSLSPVKVKPFTNLLIFILSITLLGRRIEVLARYYAWVDETFLTILVQSGWTFEEPPTIIV